MAYKNYILKAVVSISAYDKDTQTITYSMAVINNKTGSLLWRAPELKYKTISAGRKALINLNQAARVVVWKEMNLPRSTIIRVEVANTPEALKMLPAEKVTIKSKPVKATKVDEPETKYAVVQVNGVWTIKAFQVPKLMTQDEAVKELLSKVC